MASSPPIELSAPDLAYKMGIKQEAKMGRSSSPGRAEAEFSVAMRKCETSSMNEADTYGGPWSGVSSPAGAARPSGFSTCVMTLARLDLPIRSYARLASHDLFAKFLQGSCT